MSHSFRLGGGRKNLDPLGNAWKRRSVGSSGGACGGENQSGGETVNLALGPASTSLESFKFVAFFSLSLSCLHISALQTLKNYSHHFSTG
jgi:hypothetical protein